MAGGQVVGGVLALEGLDHGHGGGHVSEGLRNLAGVAPPGLVLVGHHDDLGVREVPVVFLAPLSRTTRVARRDSADPLDGVDVPFALDHVGGPASRTAAMRDGRL